MRTRRASLGVAICLAVVSAGDAISQSGGLRASEGQFFSEWVEIVAGGMMERPGEGRVFGLNLKNKSQQPLWVTVVFRTPDPSQDCEATKRVDAGATEMYTCAQTSLTVNRDYRVYIKIYEDKSRTALLESPQTKFRFGKSDAAAFWASAVARPRQSDVAAANQGPGKSKIVAPIHYYTYQGEKVGGKMTDNPEALAKFRSAKKFDGAGRLFVAAAGVLVSIPIVQWGFGDDDPNWELAKIGAGLTAGIIPLIIISAKKEEQAVDIAFKDIMTGNPEALAKFKSAEKFDGAAFLFGLAGAVLVSIPIYQWAFGDDDPNWALAKIGAGVAAGSIPFGIISDKKLKQAVDIYNEGIALNSDVRNFSLELTVAPNMIGVRFKF